VQRFALREVHEHRSWALTIVSPDDFAAVTPSIGAVRGSAKPSNRDFEKGIGVLVKAKDASLIEIYVSVRAPTPWRSERAIARKRAPDFGEGGSRSSETLTRLESSITGRLIDSFSGLFGPPLAPWTTASARSATPPAYRRNAPAALRCSRVRRLLTYDDADGTSDNVPFRGAPRPRRHAARPHKRG
jgi:hypothetical protein